MGDRADILVIDDDPRLCATVGEVLTDRGHRVRTAHKGQEALECLVQEPAVDVAIVDFKLPDISGVDLLQNIKATSPETEVILITGYASLSSALEAIHGAAASYLVKPLHLEELVGTVDKVLAKQCLMRALRESEERYRLVTESMTEAVFLLDLQGRLLMGNASGEALTGYRRDELTGRPVVSLLTPESARQAAARLDAVRAGRDVSPRFEAEVVRRDGRRVWVEVTVSSVVKDGRVVGRLGVARDLTPQKRAAEVSEALVRVSRDVTGTLDFSEVAQRIVATVLRLFQGHRAALHVLDPTSGMFICAAAAGESDSQDWIGWRFPARVGLAGRAVAERQLVTWSCAVPDTPGVPSEADDARIRDEAVPGSMAAPLTSRGVVLGALVLGAEPRRPLDDEDRRLFSVFADHAALALDNARLLADSERQRRAAERLAEVAKFVSQSLCIEEPAQRIADSVFALLRARGAVVYRLDPETERLVTVAVSTLSGTAPAPLHRGTVLPPSVGAASLAVREGRPVSSLDILADPRISVTPELRTVLEQLSFRSVLAVPLMVQGRVVGVLGIGDLAGRVFSHEEEQLACAFADHAAIALENERLYREQRDALETVKVSHARLVEAERLEAVGALASGVTHYLNNVLQALLGRVQLVLQRLEQPDTIRNLEVSERTIVDASQVLRKLQRFSEVRTLSHAEPMDLNVVVRQVVDVRRTEWEGDAPAEGVGIDVVLDLGDIPRVVGQPMALFEVLSVLLSNAVEALPVGGSIRIRTWVWEGAVHCAVADTGIGMAEDVRRRAVEPFFTTKGPERKGLGLSVAYGIIRRHQGEIEILSAEGRGTLVTLHLPCETPGRVHSSPA